MPTYRMVAKDRFYCSFLFMFQVPPRRCRALKIGCLYNTTCVISELEKKPLRNAEQGEDPVVFVRPTELPSRSHIKLLRISKKKIHLSATGLVSGKSMCQMIVTRLHLLSVTSLRLIIKPSQNVEDVR